MNKKILLLTALAALAIGFFEYRTRQSEQTTRTRFEQQFRTLDGHLAGHAGELRLQQRELGMLLPRLTQQVSDMQIALERVQQIQTTVVRTTSAFRTLLRDSLITLPNGTADTARLFVHTTPYLKMEGVAHRDTQWVRMELQDTLIQVVHRGKRIRPWLWFFSPRELVQTVRLGNPDATLRYNQIIHVTK